MNQVEVKEKGGGTRTSNSGSANKKINFCVLIINIYVICIQLVSKTFFQSTFTLRCVIWNYEPGVTFNVCQVGSECLVPRIDKPLIKN